MISITNIGSDFNLKSFPIIANICYMHTILLKSLKHIVFLTNLNYFYNKLGKNN